MSINLKQNIRYLFNIFVFYILFFPLTPSLFSFQSEDNIESISLLKEGIEFYKKGEFGKALGKFSQVLVIENFDSDINETYFYLSLCIFSLNDYEGTKLFIKKALTLNPEIELSAAFYPAKYVEIFNRIKYVEIFDQIQKELKNRLSTEGDLTVMKQQDLSPPIKNQPGKKIVESEEEKENAIPLESVDKPPVLLKTIPPKYDWNKVSILGRKLKFNILISEKGDVEEVDLMGTTNLPKDAITAVIEAINKWKFQPAKKNGINVKVWKIFTINISDK